MNADIRWKQRFEHYTQAVNHLKEAVEQPNLDRLQKAGMIQFFEMCSDLSWKLLKDYLEEQSYNDVATPRAAIKQAFNADIIKDGHAWMDLLSDRNLTSHVYDEVAINQILTLIREKYYPMFNDLYLTFNEFNNAK
jgi:nucleotidyltransferase substrate binding protein (TIGR01987 family)